jgi:N-acetyl-anhydromuramoyl-L-alanine amidase
MLELDWLPLARHCPSPNYDMRPEIEISLLVIHSISLPPGEFGGRAIDALFTNSLNINLHPYFAKLADLRVSAHFLIQRNGKLTQYVALKNRAWHAGLSKFNGLCNCNDFSIGVELEGCDYLPYTAVQYQSLIQLTKYLQAAYPQLTKQRIVGHNHIAPERKTDPGNWFDWPGFLARI